MVRTIVSLRVIAMLALVSLVAACASTPADKPPMREAGTGVIGIEVGFRPPLPLQTYPGQVVYFARAGESGVPDLGTVFVSQHLAGGRAYLLNAAPGRYVALAAGYRLMGDSYFTYFPRAAVAQTLVAVAANEVAYAGKLLLDSAIGLCPDKADELQLRIAEAIDPGRPKCGLLRMALHEIGTQQIVVIGGKAFAFGPTTMTYGGILRTLQRDADTVARFRSAASGDLADLGWKESTR